MKFVATAVLTGLALSAGAVKAVDDAELLNLSRSVLRIEAPLPAGGFSMGSGVALSADTVVTNCHVTRHAHALSVVRGGVRYGVTGQVVAAEQDLCLLQVTGLGATPASLGSTSALRVGGRVAALGFTGGVGLQRSRGQVLSLHRFQGAHVIRSSTWFNSGASGGALFGDDGALVGLLTFRLRGGLAHYYAAPVEWIVALQSRANSRGFDPVGPLSSTSQAYWQTPNEEQPRFLQAASLSLAKRWVEVAGLAQDWLLAEPKAAEAWHLLSDALQHTSTLQDSRSARACALALERDADSLPPPAATAGNAPVEHPSPGISGDTHSSLKAWPIPCPVAI